jgi:amino acid adenylation domain-containing protein/FkbM family methyltransferase
MDRKNLVADVYPLSPLQAGILYHALEAPRPGMYFNQSVYEIAGDPDLAALRWAVEAVVARHTALRTAIVWEKRETPVQVVLSKVVLPWQQHDWQDLPEAVAGERLAAFLDEERAAGFDLRRPPLLRLAAFRTAGGKVLLVWSSHHILLDGWSNLLLLEECTAFYAARREGRALALPAPRPFGDYIAWLLARRPAAAAEEFWRRALAGFRQPTPVPLAPRAGGAAAGDEAYPQISRVLPADLTLALQSFARRHRVTLNTVMQGAWALILARHGGVDDVLFGVTESGRPAELDAVETMVGLFINTLPLRVRAAPHERLQPWLRQLQARQAEAREHEHTPLPDIHGWSEVPRGVPLFETFVNYERAPLAERSSPAAPAALRVTASRSIIAANYALSLGVALDELLELRVSCDGVRFEPGSAQRLLGQLAALLRGCVESGDCLLAELSLLDAAERRQVLAEWNPRPWQRPAATVPELFAVAAATTPEATAVVCGETALTYRDLAARSRRLARHLRRRGVGPEVVVALLLERSWQAIVALLAVLEAGGAYVALEPSDPQRRLRTLLHDSGARLVVTCGGGGAAAAAELSAAGWLDLDDAAAAIAGESPDRLPERTPDNALAYVLYTSGSTGQPKGVAVEHRQLVHYVAAVREALDLGPGMSYALVSTLAADLGNTCIFPALLGGGCLHVIPRELAMDPEALAEHFRRRPVDCLKIVPSHLDALLRAPGAAHLLPARRLVLGGEASTWEQLAQLRALAPECRIFNHYGPTETTVGAATHELVGAAPGAGAVPLGRPLAHSRLYVLDAHRQLAPAGVAGELVIGGEGVARGYLRDPRGTAERFLPDPFCGRPGGRLYRTGDRARWLADGTLESLGRLDRQVKLRGLRVELGEIEALLEQHPGVGKAVAVTRGDGAAAQIVAYVVPAASAPAAAAPSRAYRLPTGIDVCHQNEHETRALFDEIFVARSYFRHGVRLPAAGCVVDVGANIGLFSLFVRQFSPQTPIYAFEPAAPLFELLRANALRYGGDRLQTFACGLADRPKVADFTYYPLYSTQSGLAALADAPGDAAALRTVLGNAGEAVRLDDEELRLWFEAECLTCRFERLSDVIRREGIERIGLLKIDVQRAELEVLAGIDEADWPRIDQVVVEVHDRVGGDEGRRVERVASLLRRRGFVITVSQDDLLRGTDRYNVYAAREPAPASFPDLPAPPPAAVLPPPAAVLRAFLAERLPLSLVPAAIVPLARLPLTRNGKVDRQALPDPEYAAAAGRRTLPHGPLEQDLAAVWSEVLKVETIGVEDNFFDLGGHSLRAMQLITRLRRRFGVELSLREFLSSPTIAGLALAIARKRAAQLAGGDVARILEEVERMPAAGTSIEHESGPMERRRK